MFYFPHWPDRRMTYSSVQGHLYQNNSNINNTGVSCQNLKIFCDTYLWSCFPALAQTQSPGLNSLTLRRAHSSHIQHTKYWVQINFTCSVIIRSSVTQNIRASVSGHAAVVHWCVLLAALFILFIFALRQQVEKM